MVFAEVVVDRDDNDGGFLAGCRTAIVAGDRTVGGGGGVPRRLTGFSGGFFTGFMERGRMVMVWGVSTG